MIELLESWSTIQNRANQALSGGITSVAEIVRISAEYDEEAKVWVAQSDDIPLVTEADTVEQLLGKIPGLIQDLVEDGDTRDNIPFRLNFHAEIQRANSRGLNSKLLRQTSFLHDAVRGAARSDFCVHGKSLLGDRAVPDIMVSLSVTNEVAPRRAQNSANVGCGINHHRIHFLFRNLAHLRLLLTRLRKSSPLRNAASRRF